MERSPKLSLKGETKTGLKKIKINRSVLHKHDVVNWNFHQDRLWNYYHRGNNKCARSDL
jgi:hypothetical protein